jgi:hypothetical protein
VESAADQSANAQDNLEEAPPTPSAGEAEAVKSAADQSATAQDNLEEVDAVFVPEGFEDLMAPQVTVVDVYFGGRRVGDVMATTTPDTIRFDDPLAFLVHIPELTDVQRVARALSGELPTNADRSCLPTPRPGCGELEVEVAGVIYSPDHFRADVIVARELLAVRNINQAQYLPPPDSGFSDIMALNAAVGGSNSAVTYGVQTRNYLSYNQTHLFTTLGLSDQRGFVVDALAAERHDARHRFNAGYFPLQEMRMAAGKNIYGVGAQTSNRTRLDLDRASGTQIQVFLPQQSRVSIRKDGQLISSRIYDAGNQVLDTRDLPMGAYPIDVEILDSRGTTRAERYYFVKSTRLPPYDNPSYWGAIGLIADDREADGLPSLGRQPIAGMGGALRTTDRSAAGASVVVGRRQLLLEASFILRLTHYHVETAAMVTDDLFVGHAAAMQGRFRHLSMSLDWLGVWRARAEPDSDNTSTLPPIGPYRFVQRSFTQLAIHGGYLRDPLQVAIGGNWLKNQGSSSVFAININTRYTLYRQKGLYVGLSGLATVTHNAYQGILSLEFSFHQDGWNLSGAYGAMHEIPLPPGSEGATESSLSSNSRLAWDDKAIFPDEVRAAAGMDYRSGLMTEGIDAEYGGPFGSLAASGTYSERTTSFGANATSTVLLSADGVAAGGRDANVSGVIIEIQGDDSATVFEVNINQARWGEITGSMRMPILLAPFASYEVELLPKSDTLVELDAGAKRVVLYPGNVAFLTWRVREVVVLLGTLVDESGEPLRGVPLRSELELSSTDDDGFFQLTVATDERVVVRYDRKRECVLEMPKAKPDRGVILAETPIRCLGTSIASP